LHTPRQDVSRRGKPGARIRLAGALLATAAALIAPAPDNLLEAYEISTAVNRTANDNPKLIEPVVPGQLQAAPVKPKAKPAPAKRAKEDNGQGALF